jgi:hypothetical protein
LIRCQNVLSATFLSFIVLTGCAKESTDTVLDTGSDPVDTGEGTGEDTGDTNTETGDPVDTGPEVVLVQEGDWNMAAPALLSDSCGVNSYQDVAEFVPQTLVVDNSSATSFGLGDGSTCTRTGMDFVCEAKDVSESALSGTAELQIESILSGTIVDSTTLDILMDVTILECTGGGCVLIELALTFPCPVQLSTTATAK